MSVDFTAGLIIGWEISAEDYYNLPDDCIEEYGLITNCYTEKSEYYIGIHLSNIGTGYAKDITNVPERAVIPNDVYEYLKVMIPDAIAKKPEPSLFLYSRVE